MGIPRATFLGPDIPQLRQLPESLLTLEPAETVLGTRSRMCCGLPVFLLTPVRPAPRFAAESVMNKTVRLVLALIAAGPLLAGCASRPQYDVVVRHGTIYDGNGSAPIQADLAIKGDIIAAIGALNGARGKIEFDARGLAVAPGFINMMSSAVALIGDGRSQSDIRQGVTLEVMGEGTSMGPLNETMKKELIEQQGDIKYAVDWSSLGEFLESLVRRGVSPNVASFIGAATPRIYVIGYEDRPPSPEELRKMCELVSQAMKEGALGVSSALIYPPGSFAKTDELVALARTAAEFDGIYISHLRSEGSQLLEAVDELIRIAREANIRAEIYHLKASGKANWPKMDQVIAKVEQSIGQGLRISADIYTYPAGATGLDSTMPPWVQDGGFGAMLKRLKDPAIRKRIAAEMDRDSEDWDNFFLAPGSPDGILLSGFKSEKLKPYTGKTLAEVAKLRGTPPEQTVMDLIAEDESQIDAIYFHQSEDNVRKNLVQPWVSFCSDSGSLAAEGVFLNSSAHPRAYGSFARLLARYVRDEKLITLQEAIRKLSALPAGNLKIQKRGLLKEGYFADVVVFDPQRIQDHATYEKPHQYATGMLHVFVNGTQVLRDGVHTGANPGRIVRGPGWSQPAPQ
jgi:N-acyl-D-amino-acid deacylase